MKNKTFLLIIMYYNEWAIWIWLHVNKSWQDKGGLLALSVNSMYLNSSELYSSTSCLFTCTANDVLVKYRKILVDANLWNNPVPSIRRPSPPQLWYNISNVCYCTCVLSTHLLHSMWHVIHQQLHGICDLSWCRWTIMICYTSWLIL